LGGSGVFAAAILDVLRVGAVDMFADTRDGKGSAGNPGVTAADAAVVGAGA